MTTSKENKKDIHIMSSHCPKCLQVIQNETLSSKLLVSGTNTWKNHGRRNQVTE